MKIKILSNRSMIIKSAAEKLVNLINDSDKTFVLGLSTGATILSICEELVRYFDEGRVSFKNIVIFHAGEYLGFSQNSKQYYRNCMQESFFSRVDISPNHIFSLNGNANDLDLECALYEEKIQSFGGMDLFLGTLGENGNLAFNEPGSSLTSRTRVKTLTVETITADARFFNNDIIQVPSQVVTMGISTICDAQRVLIAVYGINKAFAVKSCLEESVSDMNPASILQMHESAEFLIDKVAGRLLTSLVQNCELFQNS